MLKNYLNERNLLFEEKLVDQDDKARQEMLAESGGFMGVPFTVFVKSDGSKETVVGFDKGKVDQIIGEV
jgi:glutaredoxin